MAMSGLELHTGRLIHLRSLDQRLAGVMLAGLPTRESNEHRVRWVLDRAREVIPGVEPYLVPPRETPIEGPDAERYLEFTREFSGTWSEERKYRQLDPVRIPSVACIACFHSRAARDFRMDFSALTVVWLQDEFALPIDPQVLEHLKALDWERLAGDFDY